MQTIQEYLNKLATSKTAIDYKKTKRTSINSALQSICLNSCNFERIRYSFYNGPVIKYAYLANDGSEIIEKEHPSVNTRNIAGASRMKLG